MNIHWHAPGVEMDQEFKDYGERRIQFVLGRFSTRIKRLDIFVRDENGPKGGIDKSCRLMAHILPTGMIAIQDRDDDMHALLARAMERLGRSVRRELERRRVLRDRITL